MADIDLAIRYTDTDMKRLEADLDRVRTSAVTIQTTLDKINLKKLEKRFESLGKVAMNAFGRGLQTRITGITAKIFAQRQALKLLINQYALLAATPKSKVSQPAQYATTSGQSAQLATTGYGLQKSNFEDYEKEYRQGKSANQAASTKKYEDMLLRRSRLASDALAKEMSIAEVAKKYGVSQSTTRRDYAALNKQRMQGLNLEKQISKVHQSQISTYKPKVPLTKKELQSRFPAQYATTAGPGLPKKQSFQDEIKAGQASAKHQSDAYLKELRANAQNIKQAKIDKYKTIGQYYTKPQPQPQPQPQKGLYDDTFKQMARGPIDRVPRTAESYKSLGQYTRGPDIKQPPVTPDFGNIKPIEDSLKKI
ncbi:MAG TPA: hypothetical protein VMW25_02100, partial [Clostridia bacterium]|nr:hypothetical protein [Clostridia bacterium]